MLIFSEKREDGSIDTLGCGNNHFPKIISVDKKKGKEYKITFIIFINEFKKFQIVLIIIIQANF